MAPNYDLLIVTDATASMGTYLDSLRKSIPEILAVSSLSGVFQRVGIISYKDYCDPPDEIVQWSGWNSPDLLEFADRLKPTGGGDLPEAAKSALIRTLQEIKSGGKRSTLVLWYADAPPHHPSIRSYNNDTLEQKAFPKGYTDWVKLSLLAIKLGVTVFSFVPHSMSEEHSSFYVLLSQLTGGLCIMSRTESSSDISRLTLETVLHWMGQGADIDARLEATGVNFLKFKGSPADAQLENELYGSKGYLPPALTEKVKDQPQNLRPLTKSHFHASDIPLCLSPPSLNLSKRYNDPSETSYRRQVYDSLNTIIQSNVHALTYNNIFGQLWRAVCAQPPSSEQSALLNAFSNKIGSIRDPDQKRALQDWLEASFDASAKIEEIIRSVETGGPEAYLDLDADVQLTRTELLEVSKSCYSGVLKKLASIFTHLKLAEPSVKLAPGQRSIPLSLPPVEFFRILPHLVVEGTLYPPRAASLTAILSLITAVPFLQEQAIALLAPLKGTWINLEVPENISFDCAKFLLSAPEGIVLDTRERDIYAAMRRYKLIELNLESTLRLKVPWTPQKTKEVGDVKVECHSCHIKRSVTLMSAERKNVCGLCIEFVNKSPADFPDNGEMNSYWVECSNNSCQAHYVVEDVKALKVRPKCYYCRNKLPCPWLECMKCANRVIVPLPYRKRGQYLCPGCVNNKVSTVVVCETCPKALIKENGFDWLGLVQSPDLMGGKSAFKLMGTHGISVFDFKTPMATSALTFNSKKVHNPEEASAQVEHWVGTGKVELSNCALCFDEMVKSKLLPACGRKGCLQRADTECLREWYSKCEPGKLLNVMQLACPFCRRKPAPATLSRYNPRAMALGGLKNALEDRAFFFAWCIDCGFAKQAFERVCCNQGLPPIQDFRCHECNLVLEARMILETRLREEDREDNRRRLEKALQRRRARITQCPECNTYVEKTDGCNHITCICGTHFCHVCGAGGEDWSAGDIYEHMDQEHGGAFGADYDEENLE